MENERNYLSDVARKWFKAFNDHNLEALLDLYHDDAEHFSPRLRDRQPATNGLICGKGRLREWWREAFERLPSLHYHPVRLTIDENRIFMEYTRHVTGEVDLYVGEMLEMKNDRIISSAVFHR